LSQSPEATDGEPQIDIHDTRTDFAIAAPVGGLSEQPARAGVPVWQEHRDQFFINR
jgi:hypothetical protein